jgi:hypothetical protein
MELQEIGEGNKGNEWNWNKPEKKIKETYGIRINWRSK